MRKLAPVVVLAERGDVGAQFTLGEMHSRGQGVPRNEADALKWYRMAADQGHAGAQNNLGIIYTFGKGVPKDYILAYMWYDIAASNTPRPSQAARWRAMNSSSARSRKPERVSPKDFAQASSSVKARSGRVMLIRFAFPDKFPRFAGTRPHTPPAQSGFAWWASIDVGGGTRSPSSSIPSICAATASRAAGFLFFRNFGFHGKI
jgi:Sel1 repeat